MPEDLGEGLYLAAMGMGLVFFSLVIFMLILLALAKLFPSEVAEVIQTDETPAATEREDKQASEERTAIGVQEPLAVPAPLTEGRIPGAKIATMAVALYLAMEQEESAAQTPVATSARDPSQNSSTWSVLGRVSHWESQGRRPQAFGQRSQSAYPARNRLRE